MSGKASPHDIRRTLDAYGSAFLYDGVLLDPTRVVAHLDPAPNRWAAFTDDELEALNYLLGRTVSIGELGLQRATLLGDVQRELARRKH